MRAEISLDDSPKIGRFHDPFTGEFDGQDFERYRDTGDTSPQASAIEERNPSLLRGARVNETRVSAPSMVGGAKFQHDLSPARAASNYELRYRIRNVLPCSRSVTGWQCRDGQAAAEKYRQQKG